MLNRVGAQSGAEVIGRFRAKCWSRLNDGASLKEWRVRISASAQNRESQIPSPLLDDLDCHPFNASAFCIRWFDTSFHTVHVCMCAEGVQECLVVKLWIDPTGLQMEPRRS